MRRVRLNSRAARSIGYDPVARVLEVEFRGGGIYQYMDVGPEVVLGLVRAPSRGRFISRRVVGCFRCRKIAGPGGSGACDEVIFRRGPGVPRSGAGDEGARSEQHPGWAPRDAA